MRLTASSITVAAWLSCVGVQAQAATENFQFSQSFYPEPAAPSGLQYSTAPIVLSSITGGVQLSLALNPDIVCASSLVDKDLAFVSQPTATDSIASIIYLGELTYGGSAQIIDTTASIVSPAVTVDPGVPIDLGTLVSPSVNVNPDVIINPNTDVVADFPSSAGVSSTIGFIVRNTPPLTVAPGAIPASVVTCSGELTFSGGSDTVYSCSENLNIGTGFLQAQASLTFNATGQIVLDTVWLDTPAITINAGDLLIVNGAITLRPEGALLSIHSAVPEPSTYALMGLGLVGIALLTRRRPLA